MAKKGQKFRTYIPEFKIQVVEEYLSGKSGGVDAITKKYDLKSNRRIRDWLKIYKEQGPEGLMIERRGAPSKDKRIPFNLDEMSLEEQVKYLKMENDILKKLKALLKDWEEPSNIKLLMN